MGRIAENPSHPYQKAARADAVGGLLGIAMVGVGVGWFCWPVGVAVAGAMIFAASLKGGR
jgi:hypothetical protein